MEPQEIIATIREARQAQGMTQAQAAAEMGWKQPVWADYERGRKAPGLAVAERMAHVVGLEVTITHTRKDG
jgi:transcriptional regulator with XRE-family HTH domain